MSKPNLKRIERNASKRIIWLENGAKIQYRKAGGEILQETFKANDPHSVWESVDVGRQDENLDEYALGWIEWYLNAPLDEIKDDDFNSCLIDRS